MAAQLLPLRLLTSCKLFRSSRFAFAFSFRLNNLKFPSNQSLLTSSSGLRSFSIRPARSRDPLRRGSFRSAKAATGGGREKSLIEDEAELSDWVSDLKTDSFRLGLSSDGDSDRERKTSGRGNDRARVSSREGERDLGSFSEKRKSRSLVGSSERNPRGSLLKRRLGSDLDEDEEDEEKEDFLSRGERRGAGRGGRGLGSGYGQGRGMRRVALGGSDKRDEFSPAKQRRELGSSRGGRGGRGGRDLGSSYGQGRGIRRVALDGSDKKDEFSPTKQRRDLGSGRGGRGVESSYRQGLGVRRSALETSEEESDEEEDEEEDDADDDDEDGDVLSGFDDDEDDAVLSGFDDDFIGDKQHKKKAVLSGSFKSDGSSIGGDSGKPLSRSSGGEKDSYLSETRFDQCSLSPLSLKGVKAAGYERMTLVQEATLPAILKGKDVLAKARTGTGKTVAFLLPAIEIVAKLPSVDRDQKRPPINVLVICPTRELADQAATEAGSLLKFHPSIGVQVVIGGTRLALEQKRMQANPCQFLVATPGRLRDHIENTPGFATRLMGVKVLVLDEADRLLDMGFRKDIEKIVAAVPKQRQTLLFSATVPDEVRQICYVAMKRDHEFVNTVEEGSEETHSQVKQMHLVAPLEKQFPILYGLLTDHISEDVDYKVIVFCTTAMVTKLVADLLSELRLNVREIHSRKPQSYRTRVSKEFKESKGLILVSSDVSARGVDYPDVTLVIQLGVPADREQYIHRLGRTGRKGKEGKGILMLAPWEEFFLSSIKDLPITKAEMPLVDPDTRKNVERALGHVEMKNKESAYQAWLGYYNSNKNVGRDKCKLVLLANEFSRSMGLDNPPAIPKLVLGKMGLKNVPGLRAK